MSRERGRCERDVSVVQAVRVLAANLRNVQQADMTEGEFLRISIIHVAGYLSSFSMHRLPDKQTEIGWNEEPRPFYVFPVVSFSWTKFVNHVDRRNSKVAILYTKLGFRSCLS